MLCDVFTDDHRDIFVVDQKRYVIGYKNDILLMIKIRYVFGYQWQYMI